MRSVLAGCLAMALAGTCAPANAAWYEAKSKHFIVYADYSSDRLRDYATRLEKYDQAVRAVMHYDDPPSGDGNRLTVFVMPSTGAIQKLAGDKSGFLAGFYMPRTSGSVAFVPRSLGDSVMPGDMNQETVFFHEYAHHLMFADLSGAYPEWLVEGFAEFMETAQFEKDGSVFLGTAPTFRAWGLARGDAIPLKDLLAGNYNSSKMTNGQREASLYGLGWVLTHYLYMAPERPGQMGRYLAALSSGSAPLAAAESAFGDLDRLDHDIKAYENQHSIMGMKIGAARTQPGPIDIEPLTEGATAVILLRAQLARGVDEKTAEPLATQIRAIESRYPGDALVEVTLAEAELAAGHADAAAAAAERALKANPRSAKALVFKGRSLEDKAKGTEGKSRIAQFDSARDLFVAANKIDTEDPEPLYEYYMSYMRQGIRPTDNAISALHYASDLAPQDFNVRMNSAIAYLNEAKPNEARSALTVVAYSPHGGTASEVARRMIADIDAGKAQQALLELKSTPAAPSGAH